MTSAAGGQGVLPALRGLNRTIGKLHEDLGEAAETNLFSLKYLGVVGGLEKQKIRAEIASTPADVVAVH